METTRSFRERADLDAVCDRQGMGDEDGRRQICAAVTPSLCLSWLHGFWDGGDTRPTA